MHKTDLVGIDFTTRATVVLPILIILSRGNHTSGKLVQQEVKLSLQNDVLSFASLHGLLQWNVCDIKYCQYYYYLQVQNTIIFNLPSSAKIGTHR